MVMIRAIIRPEKVDETLKTLADAGYPAVTKIEVYGLSLIHISEPTRP